MTNEQIVAMWSSMTFRVDFVPTTGVKRPWELRRMYRRLGQDNVRFSASFTTEARARAALAKAEAGRDAVIKKYS